MKVLWNKQYQFERDYFVLKFQMYAPNWLQYVEDNGYDYFGNDFYIFRESDEIYFVELRTGIIVNYYKHLGRCNRTNCDLSKKDFIEFLERLNDELGIDDEN